MIHHLDPARLSPIFDLDLESQRVLFAFISLAANGELTGNEKRWATRCGLPGTRALHDILARLAATPGPSGEPLVQHDVLRGEHRTRLSGIPGLFVGHPVRGTASERQPVVSHRAAPRRDLVAVRDAKAAELVEVAGARVADLVEAWIAHLSTHQRDGQFPLGRQIAQYDTATGLFARFGEGPVIAALQAGIANVQDGEGRPEHYLIRVAERAAAARGGARSGSDRRVISTPLPSYGEDLL